MNLNKNKKKLITSAFCREVGERDKQVFSDY